MTASDSAAAFRQRLDAALVAEDAAALTTPDALAAAAELVRTVLSGLSGPADVTHRRPWPDEGDPPALRSAAVLHLLALFHWYRYLGCEDEEDRHRDRVAASWCFAALGDWAGAEVPGAALSDVASVRASRTPSSTTEADVTTALRSHLHVLAAELHRHHDRRLLEGFLRALCALADHPVTRNGPDQDDVMSDLGSAVLLAAELNPDGRRNLGVEIFREMLLRPGGDPLLRARYRLTLARALQARVARVGDSTLVQAAIEEAELADAFFRTAEDPWLRHLAATTLGAALLRRYERFEAPLDIAAAVEAFARAVGTAAGTPYHAAALSNYADAQRLVDPTSCRELSKAVDAAREAVRISTPGSPGRLRFLTVLTNALRMRYDAFRRLQDLDDAIAYGRKCVEASLPDTFDGVTFRVNVANSLQYKAEIADDPRPFRREAAALLREAVSSSAGHLRVRLTAARAWGRLAAEENDWSASEAAYRKALEIRGAMSQTHLEPADREHVLTLFEDLVTDAAAAALEAGRTGAAVERLEEGRGILLAQMADDWDLDALERAHPRLAADLRAEDRRRHEAGLPGSIDDAHDKDRQHAGYGGVLASVRKLPGFEFFRRPAPASALAGPDPDPTVLINVSGHRSDALVIRAEEGEDRIEVVPLPGVTPEEVDKQAARWWGGDETGCIAPLVEVRTWLWQYVVGPVLAHLGYGDPPTPRTSCWPRLHWCPTGRLALLPLHAALDPVTGVCTLDRVVSSYVPTLRMLRQARRRAAESTRAQSGSITVVAMENTPGERSLKATGRAAVAIARAYGVQPLVDEAAESDRVAAELGRNAWAVITAHTDVATDNPSDSGLLLHDKRLNVAEIRARRFGSGRIGCLLLTCHGGFAGHRFVNEVAHLGAAFQVAGFPHVLSSLMPARDRIAADIARRLFPPEGADARHLRQIDPALAIHDAVRGIRQVVPRAPQLWATYVHFGPARPAVPGFPEEVREVPRRSPVLPGDDRSAVWDALHAEVLSHLRAPEDWSLLGASSWPRVDGEILSLKSAFEEGALAEAQDAYARLLQLTSPPMARPALAEDPEPEQLTEAPADTLALVDTFIKDISAHSPGTARHSPASALDPED
ncbi:CHAT domain-containing protein [Streptomyces sp. NPDC052701]|uniref:CHAT domain-containing protein n=1 Tax=Streptomyces sp. NPDC052701 TaxID=3155533 RepID=UPI0034473B59